MESNLQSKYRRLNHLYKIIDKNGEEVVFRMNEAQKMLREKIENMKKEKIENMKKEKKTKLIILKARQL